METPLEMHPSSHQKDLSSPPPADQTTPPQHHAGEELPKERQRPWSYAPSEKEQFQNQGIIPDYANCPPLEQHPANYAPLVQSQQQQHQQQQQQQLQPQYNTPISPQTYAIAPEHHQHAAQVYAQPYTTQPYTNIAEQQSRTISPQAYGSHSYTNIPEQQQHQWHQQIGMTISPQYANIPKAQHNTPMSPNSYASHPYATQSYTHIPDQQRGIEQPQQYTSYTEPPRSPPNSPGPLPVKVNLEAPTRSETLPIAPDENPLQSPKSPYFPPPTRATTSHAPQPDDLGAYHQPGQTTHPNQEIKGGGWSNGLCEFSNFGICCLGLLCPCILYGRTQHRLSMKSRKEDPTNMLGYETCNGSCTAMGLLCGCQCKSKFHSNVKSVPSLNEIRDVATEQFRKSNILKPSIGLLATVQHTRTRKTYGIQGSIASDCVRATCCTCCTLIQDEKEIQKREEYRSRAATERGATLLSPYTTPGPMSYGPPR
jgi:Cys-rich protein (TIGR01571 family)